MFRPKKARRAFRLGSLLLASTLFVAGAWAETIVIDADNAENYPLAAKTTTTFEVKGELESFTLSGLIAGEGVFAKAGPGTLTLSNTGNQLAGGIQMIGPDSPSPYDTPGYGPPGTLRLQQWSSADGTSTVQGVTSEIEILTGDLVLGDTGTGSLTIGNFGTVTVSEYVYLGKERGSIGTIGLSGKDATLTVGQSGDEQLFYVGDKGIGSLSIGTGGTTAGAVLTLHGFMSIGNEASSKGTVKVDGKGAGGASTLDIRGYDTSDPLDPIGLKVGSSGEGKLEITKGGLVTVEYVTRIEKSKGGTLYIDADSSLRSGSDVQIGENGLLMGSGTVQSKTGDILLRNGGTISAGDLPGEIGVLALEVDGPTKSFDIQDGTIRVDIGLDVDGTYISDLITVAGSVAKDPTLDKGTIDFSSLHAPETYIVITSTGTMTDLAGNFNFTLNGEGLTGTRAKNITFSDTFGPLSGVGNAYRITMDGKADNMALTWNNAVTSNDWNLKDENWLDTDGQASQFLDGDAVTFHNTKGDDATPIREIKLSGNSKTVSMLTVSGDATNLALDGNLTINGALSNLTDDALKTGKLHKNGAGTLTLYGKNTIARGTELAGGTIVVAHDEALGKYMLSLEDPANSAGTVNVGGDATVKSRISKEDEAAGTAMDMLMPRTISNRFVVADGNKLTFDISDYSLTIDGVLNTDTSLTEYSKGGAIHLSGAGTFEVIGSNINPVDPKDKREFVISMSTADLGGGVYAEHAVIKAPITFKSNNGFRGGGVYAISATFGDDITFDSNTALQGAGVYAETIAFGNNTSFVMNSGQMGGGIWAHSAVFGDHTAFTSNSGQQGGAAYADDLTFGNYTTFSSNTAQWGSVAFAQTVAFGNHTVFSGNNAQFGGGIYGKAPGSSASFMDHGSFTGGSAQTGSVAFVDSATFGAHMSFSGNMSNGEGGALMVDDVSLRGNTAFSANSAQWSGGAINGKNILLDADIAGDIAFTGNTGKMIPNSILLKENGAMTLQGDGNFYFDDPVTVDTTYGGHSLSKDGVGFVQFAGENLLNPANRAGGGVAINEGIFRLVKTPGATPTDPATEATFTTGGNDGELFFVAKSGAVAGSGTVVSSNGFLIQGVLGPDDDRFETPTDVGKLTALRSRNIVAEDKLAGTLKLTGDVTLDGATLRIDASNDPVAGRIADKIEIAGTVTHAEKSTVDIGNWEEGTFTIVAADGGLDASQFAVLENGEELYYRHRASLESAADGSTLSLNLDADNLTLVWNGNAGNVWDTKTSNWSDANSGNTERFIKDDSVVFRAEGASPRSIDVAQTVRVRTMSVESGVYSFSGEAIQGAEIAVSGSAEATFSNTLDAATIKVGGSAVMNLVDGFALADPDAQGITLDAAANPTLRFVNENAMIYAGSVMGTGGVEKTGSGLLTLSGKSTSASLFDQLQGDVLLTGTWGGDYRVGAGTVLTAQKAAPQPAPAPAPGDPTISGKLQVSGTLHLVDKLVVGKGVQLDSTGTLTFDVRDDGSNGSIEIQSGGLTIKDTPAKINIGGWTNKNGTFDLITVTTPVRGVFAVPTVGGMELDNGRQTVTLQISGNTLQAALAQVDSVCLVWSGMSDSWSTSEAAWGATKFAHGDVVNFGKDGLENSAVQLGGDVVVSGMVVQGDYSFSGGSVTGVAASWSGTVDPVANGKLDVRSGTATLNTRVSFDGGMEIQAGSTAVLGDSGEFDDAMQIDVKLDTTTLEKGLFVIDRSKDYTLGNVFIGDGDIEKRNRGVLTISGKSTGKGLFTQTQGDVIVLGDAAWGGDYVQKSGTTLVGLNGAKIEGNMTLSGTVEANGSIYFGKEATDTDPAKTVVFDGATLKFGLDDDGVNSDRIVVLGDAKFGNEKNTIILDSWADGTFALMWTGMLDDIDGKFNDVQFADGELSGRQFAYLEKFDTTLLLHATAEYRDLTWNVDSGVWDYQTPNWTGSDDGKIIAGDYAVFTGDHSGVVTVRDDGVQTSGMSVGGGNYAFVGGAVSGTPIDVPGFKRDGVLRVSGDGTNVYFGNALDFDGGIVLGAGTLTTLGEGASATTKKDFLLETGGKLDLDVATGLITAADVMLNGEIGIVGMPVATPVGGTVTVDDVIVSTDVRLNKERFETLFNMTQALKTQTAIFDDTLHKMSLEYDAITVEKFSRDHDLKGNIVKMSELYDKVFGARKADDVMNEFFGFDFDEQVMAALKASLGGELAADAQTMALWNPWRMTNERLYDLPGKKTVRSCGLGASNREFWFEGYYRAANISGDRNAFGFDQKRGGMMLGVDTRLNHRLTGGLAFGYGTPQTSNGIGKIEADDYTFALYSKWNVSGSVYANMFLGYGSQEYKFDRYGSRDGKKKYDGDSMYASIEFFRPIKKGCLHLFPLAALDYQKSWTDGVNNLSGGPLALNLGSSNYEQMVLRFGFNARWQRNERLNLKTRLQYGVQVGGDTHASVRTAFAVNPGESRMLSGVNLGRNMLNVGLGGEWKLNNRARLFGDYDFDLGDRSTAHTGQFGLVTNW